MLNVEVMLNQALPTYFSIQHSHFSIVLFTKNSAHRDIDFRVSEVIAV